MGNSKAGDIVKQRYNAPLEKIILKFIADVLYVKAVICFEEYNAILDVSVPQHLDDIVERMLREDFNPLKRGELDGIN